MDEAGILNEQLPELHRIINFSILKMYLLSHRLLSNADVEELEKVDCRADLTTKLVAMVVKRTKNPAQRMLDILRDVVNHDDGSEALADMADQLQLKLEATKSARSRTPADFHSSLSSLSPGRSNGGYKVKNFPSNSSDVGYHSIMSSCISIPGQPYYYPYGHATNTPHRSAHRLSRCYSDWTISAGAQEFPSRDQFYSPGFLYPEQTRLNFEAISPEDGGVHHIKVRRNSHGNPSRNSPEYLIPITRRTQLLFSSQGVEKDSPRHQVADANLKSVDNMCRLIESTNKITSAYSTFTVQVANILSHCHIDAILLWLSCKLSVNAPGYLSIPQTSPIFKAKNIHEVFQELQGFTSWLDYTVTAAMAEELGGEEGAQCVRDYEEKLKPHLEERVAVFHPNYQTTPHGFKEVKVKMNWDLDKTDYGQVVRFRITLGRLLHTQPSCFILKGVAEGCVLLTWIVPEQLCPDLHRAAQVNKESLIAEEVMSVTISGDITIKGMEEHRPIRNRDMNGGLSAEIPSGVLLSDETRHQTNAESVVLTEVRDKETFPSPPSAAPWHQDDWIFSKETAIPIFNSGSTSSLLSLSPMENKSIISSEHVLTGNECHHSQYAKYTTATSEAYEENSPHGSTEGLSNSYNVELSQSMPEIRVSSTAFENLNDSTTDNTTTSLRRRFTPDELVKPLHHSPMRHHVFANYSFSENLSQPSLEGSLKEPPQTSPVATEVENQPNENQTVSSDKPSSPSSEIAIPNGFHHSLHKKLSIAYSELTIQEAEEDKYKEEEDQLQSSVEEDEPIEPIMEVEIEEEEEEDERESSMTVVVRRVGKAAKLKRFFNFIKQSVKPKTEQAQPDHEHQLTASTGSTGSTTQSFFRMIAQKKIQTSKRASVGSQVDSAYGSRSSSTSNSVHRQSLAAVSTLTSLCPSQDSLNESYPSSRERSRQALRQQVSAPGLICSSIAQDLRPAPIKTEKNSANKSVTIKPHKNCFHSISVPPPAILKKRNPHMTLTDSMKDEDEDPEGRLMMMTAGRVKVNRGKPDQLLISEQSARRHRSASPYSPVTNTKPLPHLTDAEIRKSLWAIVSTPDPLSPNDSPVWMYPGETQETDSSDGHFFSSISDNVYTIAKEFDAILQHIHAIRSRLPVNKPPTKPTSLTLKNSPVQLRTPSRSSSTTLSATSPSPLAPQVSANTYLEAAGIMQTAISNISLSM